MSGLAASDEMSVRDHGCAAQSFGPKHGHLQQQAKVLACKSKDCMPGSTSLCEIFSQQPKRASDAVALLPVLASRNIVEQIAADWVSSLGRPVSLYQV